MKQFSIGVDGGLACSSRPTGVEHFARSLLGGLLQVQMPDLRWHLYLPPFGDLAVALPGSIHVRRRPDANTLLKKPWFVAQTWRDGLDVLYSPGHLLPWGCRGRRVITIHDTVFDQYPDCYPAGAPAQAHASVAAACSRAAAIVVPSEATRRSLVGGYACAPDRISVIPEAARECFAPGPPGVLPGSVLDAGIRPPFLLCVGRLDRRKNLHRVVDAYRRLLQSGGACGGLVLVGPDDTGASALREQLAGCPVSGERIAAIGYVPDADLVSLYRSAAGLVYPSLAEGFGLPVLEAMACGTPVITSNASSLPEVAGTAALLVDATDTQAITDAMRRVLAEPGLREHLSAAGLQRAGQFSWRASAERLAGLLFQIATGRPAGGP